MRLRSGRIINEKVSQHHTKSHSTMKPKRTSRPTITQTPNAPPQPLTDNDAAQILLQLRDASHHHLAVQSPPRSPSIQRSVHNEVTNYICSFYKRKSPTQ